MARPRIPKIEDRRITHIKCVFADDEFIRSTAHISKSLNISEENPIHWLGIASDQVFFVGDKVVSPEFDIFLDNIADTFAINHDSILNYLNNRHIKADYDYLHPESEGHDSYDALVSRPNPESNKSTKNKPPHNYELVYAVFRARSKGFKFNQIYEMYESSKLPQYSGSVTQFNSSDSLERYYRKYKPETAT